MDGPQGVREERGVVHDSIVPEGVVCCDWVDAVVFWAPEVHDVDAVWDEELPVPVVPRVVLSVSEDAADVDAVVPVETPPVV